VNPLSLSVQLPPLAHGLLAHSSTSETIVCHAQAPLLRHLDTYKKVIMNNGFVYTIAYTTIAGFTIIIV
jgi:hypothetical protein